MFAVETDSNNMALISMTFSALSILISVMSMYAQRSIVRRTGFVSIEFQVQGGVDAKCKNRTKEVKKGMASLLGVSARLVEVLRPIPHKEGMKLKLNVYISHSKAIDMNIQEENNKARESGELAEMMRRAWDIDPEALASIETVRVERHDSKVRRKHMVELEAVTSVSPSAASPSQSPLAQDVYPTPLSVTADDNTSGASHALPMTSDRDTAQALPSTTDDGHALPITPDDQLQLQHDDSIDAISNVHAETAGDNDEDSEESQSLEEGNTTTKG